MFKHAMKQLTPLIFAGVLAIGTSLAVAQTPTTQSPSAPAPGASAGKQQIKQDRKQLRADVQKYGKKSAQAKADRKKLRQDRSSQSGG
jgi:cytochrome c556